MGRCWPRYSTLLLAGTVRRAEDAGTELERLGEHWARLHVRPESVLDPSGPSCSAQRRRCTASVSVEPPESQVEAWM